MKVDCQREDCVLPLVDLAEHSDLVVKEKQDVDERGKGKDEEIQYAPLQIKGGLWTICSMMTRSRAGSPSPA